ncbi:DNA polymerase III subunit gamma/tau [Candidatus Poriferisodalis sp.]|uniref:DNA polymerase III subunit gamma/tau n=1 Tax=Candidatus Poriferisodalis sp. TaxID=3101277 RepID=UPI003B028113
MPHQSLYRRFRPQRFAEVVGQPHLVRALRNAVSHDRVGHAYLLSGPRGTGKTSTARIMAKALNCGELTADGEPCDSCDSCRAIAAGTSMDLIELDAASNNSVNHIRDMTEKAALVSAGRRKVYLLDEVHMLSAAASNALLKTLEEPPAHVVFILATTDPNKVLSTIRSRTQQFELSLVGAEEMAPHVRAVAEAAGVPLDDAVVSYVTERGAGSVRDALSALDTVLAAGGIPDDRTDVHALVQALAAADLTALLIAVSEATAAGVDARDLAERTARRLRDMFLIGAGVEPVELPRAEIDSARELSNAMGRRANVRALEALGAALAQMPQSADRRLMLETALLGLLADDVLGGAAAPLAASGSGAPASGTAASGPSAARAAIAATQAPPSLDPPGRTPAGYPAAGPPAAGSLADRPTASGSPAPPPLPDAGLDTSADAATPADVQHIWESQVVAQLRPLAAGMFREATVLAHESNVVTIRLSNGVPLEPARRRANEAEAILSTLLDQTVRVEIADAASEATVPSSAAAQRPTAANTVADAASLPPTRSQPQPQPQSNDEKFQMVMNRWPDSKVFSADPGAS